jgi:peptide/nickel transport system ATP-binding protein
MQNNVLLSVRDIHTWFELRRWVFARVGFVRAVDGVSFDLKRGEAVAVVGESGCGKSTLARTILGLYPPTQGEIHFGGKKLIGKDLRAARWYRREVGYVQQDPYGALLPFMDVGRILAEPLLVHGVKDEAEQTRRIDQALEAVKLTPVEEYKRKFPHMLSGGQQQRVVIARARILNPQLLVADEPVSMLDASVRVEILQLLRALQKSDGLSVVYITHDLSTVRHFAERIMVMYGGKIVEQAEVSELLGNPRHPYTRALLLAISDPDPANAHTFRTVPPGEPPSLLNPPPGCRFGPRCSSKIPGLCDVEAPPEFEPTPGHRIACWLEKQ